MSKDTKDVIWNSDSILLDEVIEEWSGDPEGSVQSNLSCSNWDIAEGA